MQRFNQVNWLAWVCILTGLFFCVYKVLALNFPLLPGANKPVWSIEAKLRFFARDNDVEARLTLPESQPGFDILDETFASSGYGFTVEEKAGRRIGVWTQRQVEGEQLLYYKLLITATDDNQSRVADPQPNLDRVISNRAMDWLPAELSAVKNLLEDSRTRSVTLEGQVLQLIQLLKASSEREQSLLRTSRPNLSDAALLTAILAEGGIPARLIKGVILEKRSPSSFAAEMFEVWIDGKWQPFDPIQGVAGLPEGFFMWQRGGDALSEVYGGWNSQVRFSTLGSQMSGRNVALMQTSAQEVALLDFNIYSLPLEQQNVFRTLLLIPIGALVVVLFRVLIGIRTAGVFMPVLIALAFIQTTLLVGIVILLALLVAGLAMRSYLSRMNLLMVARISAVLIVVVFLMAAFSVLSYKMGLNQFLTITFFPMVVLSWTIERMSVLWEEDGPMEVVMQFSGSLLVAVCAYLAMTNNWIEHITFSFPEVLLIVLGVLLLLGQYSGYRLTELRRFRDLVD